MSLIYTALPKGSHRQPKREKTFRPLKSSMTSFRLEQHREEMNKYKSAGDLVGNATKGRAAAYEDPLLAQREDNARKVKHAVAPICNKGGYQLITNDADIKTAGRKI